MWVGLSAVKVSCTQSETPLSIKTNTGKLISEIETVSPEIGFYKTNLVKCLPVKGEKIRYPNHGEMTSCSKHLYSEIDHFRPKIVFLLGKQVSDFISEGKPSKLSDTFDYEYIRKDNVLYIPVHHPSYVLVYKRKQMNLYIEHIKAIIRGNL